MRKLIGAEWADHQPEVHPVWEVRTTLSLEQVRELAATKKADSLEILASTKAANSDPGDN